MNVCLPCKSTQKGAGRVALSRFQFLASVSSSSHDWLIANPFSARCINHAAEVHHLCFSVDYKRALLEILPNSKEALFMLGAFIHFFPSVACGITRMLIEVLIERLTDPVCAQNLQRPVCMRPSPLSASKALCSQSLKVHYWAICGNSLQYSRYRHHYEILQSHPSNSHGLSLNYLLPAKLHCEEFWHYIPH